MNFKTKILFQFLFLCYSCKSDIKEDLPLPEITREGMNTFGCYIGAERFIAETTLFGLVHHFNVQYYTDTTGNQIPGSLFIEATDDRKNSLVAGTILIKKMNVFDEGTFALSNVNNGKSNLDQDACTYKTANGNQIYLADSGRLVITRLDTVNKIIAGTFHFSGKDAVRLTKEFSKGRFDVHYTNQQVPSP